MDTKTATRERTGKPLIESDRVEGTTVYDPRGNNIGSIKRLMIDKISGKVAYAVMSFGGFMGIGAADHAVPWSKLTTTRVSAAIGRTSPRSSCGAPRLSRATAISTGVIGTARRSCTTFTARPITGASSRTQKATK